MRFVGMAFNLYLSASIGTAGVGRFSLVMSVYGFAITAASAGIGLAVTRVIAEADTGDTHTTLCQIRASRNTGLRYSLLTGSAAALLLYTLSSPIAALCLHDPDAAPSLRVLACSLVPLALSAVLGGYFVARRRAVFGAVSSVAALFARILTTVFFLRLPASGDSMRICLALSLGCLCAECTGFAVSALLCLFCPLPRRSRTPCPCFPSPAREIIRISGPIAVTACIRSGLGTLLHLLIPVGLARSGLSRTDALSVYGTVHGIVLPLILLPAAFLQSCAQLLIPEIAQSHAKGDTEAVRRLENRVLRLTLWYTFFVSGMCFFHADALAAQFCHNPAAAEGIRMLAPLIPVMNLDTMVDAFLKGLDEQVASMRYNILDAAFSVCMAYFLLPLLGAGGYYVLLYASETFNLILSVTKLHSVSKLTPRPGAWLLLPIFCVVGANALSSLFISAVTALGIVFRFPLSALLCELTASVLLYTLFLRFYINEANNFGKTPFFFGKSVVQYK